jgi:hypothetical protein
MNTDQTHMQRTTLITYAKILTILVATAFVISFTSSGKTQAQAGSTISLPWSYSFNSPGTLNQSATTDQSGSAYWWVKSGGQIIVQNGIGQSLQGSTPSSNPWYAPYASTYPVESDKGLHPQNMFSMFARVEQRDSDQAVSVKIAQDNLSNSANIHAWNGILLQSRWQDVNNYVYAGIRQDGHAIIRKVVNGVNYTLAEKQIVPGSYSASNPDLLPKNIWLKIRSVVYDDINGTMHVQLYADVTQSGVWTQIFDVSDTNNGPKLSAPGLSGIRTDFMDVSLDDYSIATPKVPASAPVPVSPSSVTKSTPSNSSSYDSLVLSASPVMYLTLGNASTGSESDLSGHGNSGTYKNGTPAAATLPNSEKAADFSGNGQYLTVPSSPLLSIPATRQLTWEGWIRPDTLQFAKASSDGYVDWMGKCQDYSPTCEWEARMYSSVTSQGRPGRLSAYVFKPTAGLGSAADWQPTSTDVIQAGQWIHVVAEYQTIDTPSQCNSAYPGTITIWVDGVRQSFADHAPTGCMSQFGVKPIANNSPLTIGTMGFDTWFQGAIGKVAVYNRLLSPAEISQHYQAMTGKTPTGSCGVTCTLQ